jgi:protein TonB
MSIELSANMIKFGLLVVLVLTGIIFFIVRNYFNRQASLNLTEINKGRIWKSPLEGRNKYPQVDIFKLSGTFMNYGLVISLLFMVFAFGWTTREKSVNVTQYLETLADEIELETPRTSEPPPPPPPPPPPTAVELVASDLPEAVSLEFKDQSIDEYTSIDVAVVEEKKVEAVPPPPPPPPRIEENEREIFKVVEENPTFPGCEEVTAKTERQQCAEKKMLEFIYANINYPSIARENGIQGMVVVKFVVERDGSISNIEIGRDIGGGCGNEAVRVVSIMPKWNPGKQRGTPVRVMFTLPVKFQLT